MTDDKFALLRQIIVHQRARLNALQYDIETRAFDLTTLYQLADDAADDLARTEEHLRRLEKPHLQNLENGE